MTEVKRKVQGEAEAVRVLDAWRETGKELKAWCKEEGWNAHSVAWWRTHLGGRGIRLLEVTPVAALATRPAARYILHLNELAIEVSDDFREETLSRLLDLVSPC